jgi:hypothetical protein
MICASKGRGFALSSLRTLENEPNRPRKMPEPDDQPRFLSCDKARRLVSCAATGADAGDGSGELLAITGKQRRKIIRPLWVSFVDIRGFITIIVRCDHGNPQ